MLEDLQCRACPRCKGALYLERDRSVSWWHCVNCGRDFKLTYKAPNLQKSNQDGWHFRKLG